MNEDATKLQDFETVVQTEEPPALPWKNKFHTENV